MRAASAHADPCIIRRVVKIEKESGMHAALNASEYFRRHLRNLNHSPLGYSLPQHYSQCSDIFCKIVATFANVMHDRGPIYKSIF